LTDIQERDAMSRIRAQAIVVAGAAWLLVAMAWSGAAVAQDGEATCTLDPVSLPLFDATPAAALAGTPVDVPDDIQVDDATIEDAVIQIVACINTNDPAYQYAIFTDRYLAEQFADPTQTYQPAFELQISFGPSQEPGSMELEGISGIEQLESGQVSVVVELTNSVSVFRDTLILVPVDGVWLIDSIAAFDPPR
jgi:hypothetical protein